MSEKKSAAYNAAIKLLNTGLATDSPVLQKKFLTTVEDHLYRIPDAEVGSDFIAAVGKYLKFTNKDILEETAIFLSIICQTIKEPFITDLVLSTYAQSIATLARECTPQNPETEARLESLFYQVDKVCQLLNEKPQHATPGIYNSISQIDLNGGKPMQAGHVKKWIAKQHAFELAFAEAATKHFKTEIEKTPQPIRPGFVSR